MDEEQVEHTKSITGFNYCGGCGKAWPCEVARLKTEIGHLSDWALRAYTFIQASPCRCGHADECEAHTLISEYRQI